MRAGADIIPPDHRGGCSGKHLHSPLSSFPVAGAPALSLGTTPGFPSGVKGDGVEVVENLALSWQSQCREVGGVLEAGLEEAWLRIRPGVPLASAQGSGGRNHGNVTDSGAKRPNKRFPPLLFSHGA